MPWPASSNGVSHDYSGARVLVTGGLGFIGSNLARRLVQARAQVTLMDALLPGGGGRMENIDGLSAAAVVIADLRDTSRLPKLVEGQDFVFHLAGQVSHGDSMRDPQLDLAVNAVATLNLVEACRRHAPATRLLYTSTRQVYGRPQRLPVDEDHPVRPVDINGVNKFAAEYYHLLYDTVYGLHSTVLRLTNTYGPRQNLRGDRQGVAAVFIRRALCGEAIHLYDGGSQRRDFNYVDDVASALLAAAATEACHGRVFNLGANQPHSLAEFAQALARCCPCPLDSIPFPADEHLIDIGDYYGDDRRLRGVTGWQPRVSLDDGLAETVAFYRRHPGVYC